MSQDLIEAKDAHLAITTPKTQDVDRGLLATLTSGVGLPIRPDRPSEEGPWIGHGATLEQLNAALREIEYGFAHASPKSLSAALAGLAKNTAAQKTDSLESSVAGAQRLMKMLLEFPADCALEAINDWPKTPNGKWWPTEAELRAECEKRVDYRRRLQKQVQDAQRAMARGAHKATGPELRKLEPHGATQAYFNEVERKYGADYAFSWLNRRNCDFTESTVYTTGIGRERLSSQTSGIAAKHGVTIRECKEVSARFSASFAR